MNETSHVLDNFGWHALNSHQARFALGTGLAALAEPSDAAYRDLEQIVAPGEVIALIGAQPPAEIPGWMTLQRLSFRQMVCDQPVPEAASTADVLTLTAADLPHMLHLIELAQPGPFLPRVIELGTYLGVRQQGQLVAMAAAMSRSCMLRRRTQALSGCTNRCISIYAANNTPSF